MDLQSILNASGSSSASLSVDDKPSETSSQIDLERILRDDDDDDDTDNENDRMVINLSTDTSHDDEKWSKLLQQSKRSEHTPEDWAVLQAILGEDDDDDDVDFMAPVTDNDDDDNDTASKKRVISLSNLNVDEILQSDDDNDDDGSANDSITLPTISTLSSPTRINPISVASRFAMFNRSKQENSKADGDNNSTNIDAEQYTDHDTTSEDPSSATEPFLFGGGHLPQRDYENKPVTSASPAIPSNSNSKQSQVDDKELSKRALQYAQNYETRLYKSGHREIVSPLVVKRRLRPKVELTSRSMQKKRPLAERLANSTAPRYNFGGVVENKTMSDISANLLRHSQPGSPVPCGLPTCISFNSKFIAIGTQKGIILVFDLFEVLRQRLGATNEENWNSTAAGAITSLDINNNGELVIAGYSSGILVLWDTIRGVILRTINDTHPSPITSVRFLSNLKAVTVDAGGLVNKLTFARNILWSNYSVEPECLLDGTAGQILAMDVLPKFSSIKPQVRPDKLAPILTKFTLIALSSERSSFAVVVDPVINVLHRWSRPTPEQTSIKDGSDDATFLPCLAWGWGLVSGGNNIAMPILARAWGCCLQLLVASFPSLDDVSNIKKELKGPESYQQHWPAFGMHEEVDATVPIVALDWLSERSLVYLTVNSELTIVDSVMMTLLERLDLSGLKLVYAEFALSRTAAKNESGDDDAPVQSVSCTTFQNSIRSSDDRLLVLYQEDLKCVSLVGARRRISSLEEDGEWLEALALALDHYESTVSSQEDRRRDPNRRKDLSKHPEFSGAKSEDEEWIAKLLMRYVNLAIDNAPETYTEDSVLYSPGAMQGRIDLAQSHFQMLAGVCVEFCVVTRRLDLLYGAIFRRFHSVGFIAVFLDVLEPYILNDKLTYIAPEVMSYFVEHCKVSNGIATVERCLLHMDCTIMDFDTILHLLKSNEMYTALIYVFNQGLDDYITPLEIMLEKVFDSYDLGHASMTRRIDGVHQTQLEKLGYKSMLYLQACFRGKNFPQEKENIPEDRQQAVRCELLDFLMQKSYKPSPQARKPSERVIVVGQRALQYPHLRALLQVDTQVLLDTIALAISTMGTEAFSTETLPPEQSSLSTKIKPSSHNIQNMIDVLAKLILPTTTTTKLPQTPLTEPTTNSASDAFLDFSIDFLLRGVVKMSKSNTYMALERLSHRYKNANDSTARLEAQRLVMDVLASLPRDSYDPDMVLSLIDSAKIHRAALLLHQQVASSWQNTDTNDIKLRVKHFRKAIDCYLDDEDPVFREEVFSYIRKECSGALNSSEFSHGTPKTLRDALYTKLPSLVHLDSLKAAALVAELFVDDIDFVINRLYSENDGEAQYLFLRAIISGDLVQYDPVAGSVINLTMDHHSQYLKLITQLHPDKVYEYLSTHDNYRADEALKLCQKYNIADASAYLLEKTGNVSSALQLILQTLESRMMALKRTFRGMSVDQFRDTNFSSMWKGPYSRDNSDYLISKQDKEIEGVKRILVVALDLCERNSGDMSNLSEHGSHLWFNVLDRLINAKGFLRLSKEQPQHSQAMSRVLGDLLRQTMQRMVSNVPLSDLVRKVTSDHSGSRLGELRELVVSLLNTYGFELRLFDGANNVFLQESLQMKQDKQKLKLTGSQVSSIMGNPLNRSNSQRIASEITASVNTTVLQVGTGGHAFLANDDDLQAYGNRYGSVNQFTNSLSKLQNRRRRVTRQCVSMQTSMDKMYHQDEIDPVVAFEERPVGMLGDPAHRGRLMSFI